MLLLLFGLVAVAAVHVSVSPCMAGIVFYRIQLRVQPGKVAGDGYVGGGAEDLRQARMYAAVSVCVGGGGVASGNVSNVVRNCCIEAAGNVMGSWRGRDCPRKHVRVAVQCKVEIPKKAVSRAHAQSQ